MYKTFILGLSSVLLTAQMATAGGPPPPTTTYNVDKAENEVFVGFNWTFGQSVPQIELGYRNLDVNSNGDVKGAGASVSFDWTEFSFDKIKLFGIRGNDDVQGQLGGGFSLLQQQWLGTASIQGNYLFINADLLGNGTPQFGGGINTISDYKKPAQQVGL